MFTAIFLNVMYVLIFLTVCVGRGMKMVTDEDDVFTLRSRFAVCWHRHVPVLFSSCLDSSFWNSKVISCYLLNKDATPV